MARQLLLTECPSEILHHIVEYITANYRKVLRKRDRALMFKTIHSLQSTCKLFNHSKFFNDFWWTVFEREAGYILTGSDSIRNQLESIKSKLIKKNKIKRSVLMFLSYIQFGSYKKYPSLEYDTVKVALLGSSGVGKSSLIYRFRCDSFQDSYHENILEDIDFDMIIDGMRFMVVITDTRGFEEFPSWNDQYMRSCTCFLVVASVERRDSLTIMEDIVERIHRIKDSDEVPCLLVLNKIDMISSVENPHTIEEVREIATDKSFVPHQVMDISAKTGHNVKACLEELIRTQLKGDSSRLQFYEKFLCKPDVYFKDNARNKCIVM